MATFTSRFKRDAGNTLDLKTVIHLGIKRFFILSATFAAFWLTEIDAAGQFAHAQDVEAVSGNVSTQRTECFQPLIQFCRTQIAE